MNLLFRGFITPSLSQVIRELQREIAPDHSYVICEAARVGEDFQNATIISTSEIVNGAFDVSSCEPLDERSIAEFVDTEILCLKMVERHSVSKRFAKDIPYDFRKRYYYRQLRYWLDFFLRHPVDFVFFSNYPHMVFDYIIYSICRKRHIGFLFAHQGPIPSRFFISESITNILPRIAADLQKYIRGEGEPTLEPETDNYFRQLTQGKPPFYMKDGRRSLKRSLKKLISSKTRNSFKPVATLRKFKRYLRPPSFGARYIYFALHYQPELTTSPLAGAYVDQYLAVDLLSRAAGDDCQIYVKDHPRQTMLGRGVNYYSDLAALPNIRLIDASASSQELIKSSLAVATCTGTVALEALVHGKPAILFGLSLFNNLPNALPVKTYEDCKQAVRQLGKMTITEGSLKAALSALEKNTYRGYVDAAYRQQLQITEAENVASVSKAFLANFQQIVSR